MDLSPAHADARLQAQRPVAIEASHTQLEAGSGNIAIEIHGGARPAPGADPGQPAAAVLLVEAATVLDAGQHRIALPVPIEALITTSTTATWARVLNRDGAWWADMDVSDDTGSAPLRLDTTALVAGGLVRLTHGMFQG